MLLEKKEFIFLFITGVVAYVLLVAGLYLFQRKIIYYPAPVKQERSVYNALDMSVIKAKTSDGLELEGWYKAPEGNKPVIVVFHGNASHMGYSAWKVRPYIDQGYGALLPAYRGYAGNPGTPTEDGLYKDARAFLDWLEREARIPQARTIILGESLGTGVALEMVSGDYKNVKAVILESPYTSFVDMAREKFYYIPYLSILVRDQYRNLDKISKVEAPVLIVHGDLDVIVPVVMGRKIFKAANEPKAMAEIPLAGHNDLYMHGADQRVLHFLSRL